MNLWSDIKDTAKDLAEELFGGPLRILMTLYMGKLIQGLVPFSIACFIIRSIPNDL